MSLIFEVFVEIILFVLYILGAGVVATGIMLLAEYAWKRLTKQG